MRNGYFLVEAMIAIIITGIVAGAFTMMNYYTKIQSDLLKQQNTKTLLEVIRSRLINLSSDPDSDSYFELLKEDANNTLPVSVGIGVDAWGKAIYYSTIDLGNVNLIDSAYADTNTSISPNSNIAGRLISYGEDSTLDTNATHTTSQGDDIMLEIGLGEINHFKLYGSSEIITETRGYNSAIVSATEPTTPINGALWYDTSVSKLKIYSQTDTNWTNLN
ncbi:type II secretion system protein [Candidatus Sulfurimonas marisnigri]|uniref:Type II secretion system protein n=1 Tax=Candidatus Sulfurimonas marisnigri TaxID=2740405 RepID=A0A7S7M1N6_9BACT|nr:type II secretion system protein [Candidatus Sulfurimonas marisnigri]QOY55390.1 type II secretion system protein [Candidatus Sulfurimonas marisnigri]